MTLVRSSHVCSGHCFSTAGAGDGSRQPRKGAIERLSAAPSNLGHETVEANNLPVKEND